MNIQQRISTCRLLSKMEQHKEISAELGLKDSSSFISPPQKGSRKEDKEGPER